MYIIAEYGTRLQEVARNVKENVKYTVETQLGLDVSRVNVYIQGVQTGVKGSFRNRGRYLNMENIDGPQLKKVIAAGTAMLYEHKDEVDALNVFRCRMGIRNKYVSHVSFGSAGSGKQPVTSLAMWFESAAQGALMGARGNFKRHCVPVFRGFAMVAGAADSGPRGSGKGH